MPTPARAFRGRLFSVPVKNQVNNKSTQRVNRNNTLARRQSQFEQQQQQRQAEQTLSYRISPLTTVSYQLTANGIRNVTNGSTNRRRIAVTPRQRFNEIMGLYRLTFIIAQQQVLLQQRQEYRRQWSEKTSQDNRPSSVFGFDYFTENFKDSFDRGFFGSLERFGQELVEGTLNPAIENGLEYSRLVDFSNLPQRFESPQF